LILPPNCVLYRPNRQGMSSLVLQQLKAVERLSFVEEEDSVFAADAAPLDGEEGSQRQAGTGPAGRHQIQWHGLTKRFVLVAREQRLPVCALPSSLYPIRCGHALFGSVVSPYEMSAHCRHVGQSLGLSGTSAVA